MPTKLTKTTVDRAESTEKDYFVWDRDLTGFGVKISKGGRKSYVCKYRVGSGRRAPTRRMTIGAHGSPWTVDGARNEARKILGRAANGEDPAVDKQNIKNQITVSDLCDDYLKNGIATKKASTIATDRGRIERHIKPLLGKKKVPDINKANVSKFLQDVANGKTAKESIRKKWGSKGSFKVTGGKGTASRTVGLLGGIFSYAIDCGLIENNPVQGVKRFQDKKGERFLSSGEILRLGQTLSKGLQLGHNDCAIDILKLLILTGSRKKEIESIKWKEVDFESAHLRLADSKTGQKLIALSTPALEILRTRKRHENSEFVFPASSGEGYYQGTPKVWQKIRQMAELTDVRIHDLRHSFASVAVSEGASLPIIGALLGHTDSATTQRYAHLQNDPLRAASEATAIKISAMMNAV